MSTYSGAGVGLTVPASVALAGENSCSRDWHQVASCEWTIIVVSAFNILQQPRQQVMPEFKSVWGTRFSMLDCHLVEGVWYKYDWDTGSSVLL